MGDKKYESVCEEEREGVETEGPQCSNYLSVFGTAEFRFMQHFVLQWKKLMKCTHECHAIWCCSTLGRACRKLAFQCGEPYEGVQRVGAKSLQL